MKHLTMFLIYSGILTVLMCSFFFFFFPENLDNIRPVCLPTAEHSDLSFYNRKIFKIAGWGSMGFG